MFKKTQQTNTPKIIPMEADTSNIVPMMVDDSKIVPMTVEDNNQFQPEAVDVKEYPLTEEDFIPSVEAIEAAKPVVVLVKDQVVEAQGKTCRVVEVVADGRYHLKNVNPPHDSFIVTGEELV